MLMSVGLLSTLQLGNLAESSNTSYALPHDAELLFQFFQAGDFALQKLNTILAPLQLHFHLQAVLLPAFFVLLICRIIATFVLTLITILAQQCTQEIVSLCLAWTELWVSSENGGAGLVIVGFEHACLHEDVV